MKKYNVILLVAVMLLSLGSCETVDFGDTNENPNGSLELNSGALLTAAQRQYTAGIGFRDWLGNPHLYVQYQAQPSYPDPSRYAETPVDWEPYYVQTLQNLQQILNVSQDESVTSTPAYQANGSVDNQIAVARIMKVIIFKRLTDTYGDIPYMEALNPEIQSPAYTPQQEIYQDFISELKEARDMLNPAEMGAQGDIFYGGDVEAWGKFANSLLLSVTMQISETELAGTAATEFQAALNNEYGVIETVSEEAWYTPVNVATLDNPWVAFRPADYNMAEFIQDALQGDNDDYSNDMFDERLRVYSTAPEAPGLVYGVQEGVAEGTSARISTYITSPIAPFPILTSAYTYLNRAEAAELGWTSEDAEAMLEAGIIQSYTATSEKFGTGAHVEAAGLEPMVITEDAAAFAASRLEDASATGILQVIGEEKWAALFPQGFLAWNEWRRTGWPDLTPSPDPLNDGGIPTRYLYPVNEINLNNANYQTGVSNLDPATDKNTSRVWWDQ
ncbi:SusD/RagB family nutrient-binding outer membrane lipoprotein [Salinimicrobium sp. GXAS 041]|uniref:SusD/RagB family nutrient-binding outer membrane lipoprotein n=1 Tax=Salinimicrobium sp. GXAS 041 TaxID=3400806 RepID=UPI003C76C0E2